MMFIINNVSIFTTINNIVTDMLVTEYAHLYFLKIDSEKWNQFYCLNAYSLNTSRKDVPNYRYNNMLLLLKEYHFHYQKN